MLDRAYASPDGIYREGDTTAIAGTRGARDIFSDVLLGLGLIDRLPGSRFSTVRTLQKTQRVIGHSLGGTVAHQWAPRRTTAYNPGISPFDPWRTGKVIRNRGDPVSLFWRSAKNVEHRPVWGWSAHGLSSFR